MKILPDNCLATFRIERKKAFLLALWDAAETSFFMYIAISIFDAAPWQKSLIAGGGNLGMLLTPLIVYWFSTSTWQIKHGITAGNALAFTGMLLASAFWNLPALIAGIILSKIAFMGIVPLYTQLYSQSYPNEQRGELFAKSSQVRIVVAGLLSLGVGHLLDISDNYARWLLVALCFCILLNTFLCTGYPPAPVSITAKNGWLRSFRHLKQDKTFMWILVGWMFLGIGNLMMLPLRVEFLANKDYGINYSPFAIAAVTVFIPCVSQFFFIRLWGKLFDKISFFLVRVAINASIATSIILFFIVAQDWSIALAALLNGISMSGASIAWSLWVTKLAKPEDVADYMSVHTFLTGLRGIAAPFIAFYAILAFDMKSMACAAIALIAIASLMHIPEIRSIYRRRQGKPLTQDIIE